MLLREKFNDSQLSVFKTRQCTSGTVFLPEGRAIGKLLNLTGNQVRNWFHNHRKELFEMPQVAPEIQKSIDNLLSEVKKEMEESHANTVRLKPPPTLPKRKYQKQVLETRFRQSQADEQDLAETFSDCGKSTGSERISESSPASKPLDAESLPNSKDSFDNMDPPKKQPKFTEFQLAFFKTRHCISRNISLKEARTIGQQLNLNAKRVRSWFHNNKKKRFEIPQVEPEDQNTIDNLLIEVRKQLGESHSHIVGLEPQPPFLTKEYRLKILETRYRQSHKISSLECHLIGRHFNFDGEPIGRWFKRRSRSGIEDDPNFVVCPRILKLLSDIGRKADEQSEFKLSGSQRKYLEERFSINTKLLKNERIAISEAIGVPDYFIKAWLKKRTKAERERHDRAALALRLSGSGKDVESVSKSSSASVPSDTETQSNSDDWFEKMATVQETSEIFLPVDLFSIPTSSEFTTSSDSTIYVPSIVPETPLSPRSTDISNIHKSWGFHNDSINSGADFCSSLPYTRSPSHEIKEPWAPRNEIASHEWSFENHQMYPSSPINNSHTSSELFSSLPYPNQNSSIPWNAMDSTQPQPTDHWSQKLVKMSLRVFDKFTLAVCMTRQCTSESISRKESKALARRLNLTGGQVRSWFYRNKNKKIEMPQVAPEIQKSVDNLLSEVKKEMEESHSDTVQLKSLLPLSKKGYQKSVLETRFRQSSRITGLECHLIGRHLEMEGQSVTNWFSRRKKPGKEAEPNFVICPKVLEFLDNTNREVRKQIEFKMSSSQETYLEQRFSMNNFLGKEERILMSDTIGVPDYWIKTWFFNKLSSPPTYPIDNNYPAAEQHNPGQYIDMPSFNPWFFNPLNTNQSVQTQIASTINHQMHNSSSTNNSQTSSVLFSSLQVLNQSSSIAFDAMDSTQPQPTDY
ncbi:hypothetical protein CAEBREN_23390 [Caenorhabditis brenneri]|uniref:Homeobox domain-containing protein n=1 Tax=Caenorhabditis brenneri TaxID=135651 RepID=G0P065_CAEBE|nr:hypothetical protein CAEBREN_23390 [Caenorhabditis brenneri]